jgi:hypothetical protein
MVRAHQNDIQFEGKQFFSKKDRLLLSHVLSVPADGRILPKELTIPGNRIAGWGATRNFEGCARCAFPDLLKHAKEKGISGINARITARGKRFDQLFRQGASFVRNR